MAHRYEFKPDRSAGNHSGSPSRKGRSRREELDSTFHDDSDTDIPQPHYLVGSPGVIAGDMSVTSHSPSRTSYLTKFRGLRQDASLNEQDTDRHQSARVPIVASTKGSSSGQAKARWFETSVQSSSNVAQRRPESASLAANPIPANLDIQLSTLLDQQNAVLTRSLLQLESKLMTALDKLDRRISTVEESCKTLEKTTVGEIRQLKQEAALNQERLAAVMEEKDLLAKRLATSAAFASSGGSLALPPRATSPVDALRRAANLRSPTTAALPTAGAASIRSMVQQLQSAALSNTAGDASGSANPIQAGVGTPASVTVPTRPVAPAPPSSTTASAASQGEGSAALPARNRTPTRAAPVAPTSDVSPTKSVSALQAILSQRRASAEAASVIASPALPASTVPLPAPLPGSQNPAPPLPSAMTAVALATRTPTQAPLSDGTPLNQSPIRPINGDTSLTV